MDRTLAHYYAVYLNLLRKWRRDSFKGHAGRPGKVGGSLPHYLYGLSEREIEKRRFKGKSGEDIFSMHESEEYTNVRRGNDDINDVWNVKDIQDKGKDKKHEHHAGEMGMTIQAYKEQRVKAFTSPLTGNMEEMIVEGRKGYYQVYRYDYVKQAIAIARNGEVVSTYYALKVEDWEEMIKRNGVKNQDD